MINKNEKLKVAIIGLGYVGLPLALEFAKKRPIIAFDIEEKRIKELKSGIDKNLESTKRELQESEQINFTSHKEDLVLANCFIVTVPTPIDKYKKPDLRPLLKASDIINKVIKKGDLIIYESTVYPGCIEEQCVPVLERDSKLRFNQDFFCGYSPERINPGDKKHTISKIKKITSGSTSETADIVDDLYNEIIIAGTYKAQSIKVAEAAKVIENTQRDLNIALVNELSIIFNKMNIDTQAVLDAAGSKWNFLPFTPGLVGGHCIGVDPYYLTYKANEIGYQPKVILAGRELNDSMGNYVASQFIVKMQKKNIQIIGAKILIMGLTFKENCADTRNSGIESVIKELIRNNCKIDLHDPWVDNKEIKKKYGINLKSKLNDKTYDGIIIAVAHDKFKIMGIEAIHKLCKKDHIIYDLKYLFSKDQVDLRL
ncbi:Vi polysaccharide biosynthesis UDP-N-acetylglucosamine C-6 dehydrogenase TviB [Candidatus Pelagibacter bacterium]|nr:Vi polysaccharide biosynthesis UDP-N-acetylglucosamine C-6 dehydrogenase TviB [Candidatus Pelagibacter bacterium]MDA8844904.1 Vi polysaccharide biosynthesis UDP-N-acetylglucosamine C-6 dehydrogenase TviB [Candidatus Pelagibacter bacterium]